MWFESIRELVTGADVAWQWAAVILAGAVPLIESYGAAALGTLAGTPLPLAIAAGIIGNLATMLIAVTLVDRLRRRRLPGSDRRAPSPRRQRLERLFDRYGVAGVSLVGQTLLPSQITSMALVGLGARRRTVILWQSVSIALWATVFGSLAAAGATVLG